MGTAAFTLRPAFETDFPAIRQLIHEVQINPMGLDWRRFILAVDEQDKMIGCGQIKLHGDGTHELASIAVVPECRGLGVARAIIEHLMEAQPGALYLTCRSPLGGFYERFGFRRMEKAELPPYFRRLYRLAETAKKLHLTDKTMLVMMREG